MKKLIAGVVTLMLSGSVIASDFLEAKEIRCQSAIQHFCAKDGCKKVNGNEPTFTINVETGAILVCPKEEDQCTEFQAEQRWIGGIFLYFRVGGALTKITLIDDPTFGEYEGDFMSIRSHGLKVWSDWGKCFVNSGL